MDSSNDKGFDETMLETIRKLEENMKNMPDDAEAPNEEEMAKIWAQMTNQSENEDDIFPPFFLDIMQKLLAKDVLYPPLKDLSTKVKIHLSFAYKTFIIIKVILMCLDFYLSLFNSPSLCPTT